MNKPRKIALVGTASSGCKAPFGDPSWEIWGCGARADYVTRADRWFELHRLDRENPEWSAGWRAHIKKWHADTELMMMFPEPDLGNVVQFPTDHLAGRFGTFFMTSSFSWMMGMAIDEMVSVGQIAEDKQIGLWGVDMEYGTEYREQRAGLRHFMALAHALGIKVSRVTSSGIAYDPIPYPLFADDPQLAKIDLRRDIFEKKQSEAQQIIAHTERRLAEIDAVLAEIKDAGRIAVLEKERAGLYTAVESPRSDLKAIEGSLEELAYWRDYLRF